MDYESLCAQLQSLAEAEPHYVPLLANAAALLYDTLPALNWAGFYLLRNGRLVLGPFCGKVACIHILPGKGVCGIAAQRGQTVVVPNVHQFPGHIACDSASNAEIVVPIRCGDAVIGVLDLDSPVFDRFTDADRAGLEAFAKVIEANADFGEML